VFTHAFGLASAYVCPSIAGHNGTFEYGERSQKNTSTDQPLDLDQKRWGEPQKNGRTRLLISHRTPVIDLPVPHHGMTFCPIVVDIDRVDAGAAAAAVIVKFDVAYEFLGGGERRRVDEGKTGEGESTGKEAE
jgi:hypothetical protein